jgi:putative ABC transport system permease protein
MSRFKLAMRLLKRDGRSGELTLLVLALLIAVASSTTISLFVDRLQRTLSLQAAEFLAGDLVIASPSPILDDWLKQGQSLDLHQTQTTEFSSVLLENQQMLLASIKAVSQDYPLRGFLKTRVQPIGEETKQYQGPEAGTTWVEQRVMSALNLNLGDTLTVGEKPLRITQILTYEPDKRGDFYSFSPRVMINQIDLQATGVIQPGSHVHYFFQFTGPDKALNEFKKTFKPQLNPSQRILDIHEDRPELGSALQRAERYLGLCSVVVTLIAGVAIAMAAGRYTERHFNTAALLRCLGCRQAEIMQLFTLQFLVLGTFTSATGCVLGWLGQAGLFYLLKSLLPDHLANPGLIAIGIGFITGMVILLGFTLPPLLRLQQVSALRVLRRELEPLPSRVWLIYLLVISLLSVMIWQYSNDWQITASIIGIGFMVLLVVGLLINGLLRLCRHILARLPLTLRFGLQGILRNRQASISQILAFTITMAAMNLSFIVRNDLIDQWQQQLPENAPNYFALNIVPEQRQAFQNDLNQAGILTSELYPVIRGRLVAVNNEPVQKRVSKDTQGEAATQRELSLTWAEHIPEDNSITAGSAWSFDQVGLVSVEQKLADNLGIAIGDQLQFTVGSAQIRAKVANIRSLQWDTMKPNFYMIFSPGTLDGFPTTYLTSFFLPDSQKVFLNQLLKSYPATTILEVDQILKQFKTILAQLTRAIDLLLYFALLAGILVLLAAVFSTLDKRIYEGALMRTLGARRSWLRKTHIIEFGLLGSLAGMLAAVITQAVLYVLYSRVMHIPYQSSLYLWLSIPIIGCFLVSLAGYLGVREVVNHSPMRVLRRL